MYDTTIGERIQWLLDNIRKPNGTTYTLNEVIEALKPKGVSRTYFFALKCDERKNPSLHVLEALAGIFGIHPGFFSKDPRYYVPPVPSQEVQVALRAVAPLNAEAQRTLDQLLARADELALRNQPGAKSDPPTDQAPPTRAR